MNSINVKDYKIARPVIQAVLAFMLRMRNPDVREGGVESYYQEAGVFLDIFEEKL